VKLQLSRGEAFLRVQYGERTVERTASGSSYGTISILSVRRTTTVRIELPSTGARLAIEQTVSCSYLDQFTRRAGRREAMRKLFKADGPCHSGFLNRQDRAAIAAILLPPRRK
jgi:hypothetical protein